jgi:hypothetical protein
MSVGHCCMSKSFCASSYCLLKITSTKLITSIFHFEFTLSLQLLPSMSQPFRLLASRRVALHLQFEPTRQCSSVIHYSTQPSKPSPQPDPSLPSFNLFREIQNSSPLVRYTVYAGLGLMITVESSFWFNIIKAKFFPAKSDEERAKAEELMENLGEAVAGARKAWMGNYGRYYGGYVWGVGER